VLASVASDPDALAAASASRNRLDPAAGSERQEPLSSQLWIRSTSARATWPEIYGQSSNRVETGAEVIIERDAQPVAVIRAPEPVQRKISECIALMPADSTGTIDPDFAKDVEGAIAAHREALESPAWD
jgi:hypothetical protein